MREHSIRSPVEGTGTGRAADWLMSRSMQSSTAARLCTIVHAVLSLSTSPLAAAELCRGFAPGIRPTLQAKDTLVGPTSHTLLRIAWDIDACAAIRNSQEVIAPEKGVYRVLKTFQIQLPASRFKEDISDTHL